jgi:excinuclease UvrABC nuclease subunit
MESANLGPAKEKMVSLIASLETISTDTELEALVLEANLVRKHQPPYNVLLAMINFSLYKITKEEHPRIFPVRKSRKMVRATSDHILLLHPFAQHFACSSASFHSGEKNKLRTTSYFPMRCLPSK